MPACCHPTSPSDALKDPRITHFGGRRGGGHPRVRTDYPILTTRLALPGQDLCSYAGEIVTTKSFESHSGLFRKLRLILKHILDA